MVPLEMAGSWGISDRRRKVKCITVIVEGLIEPAWRTMDSLNWGKDQGKIGGYWAKDKTESYVLKMQKGKKCYDKPPTCNPCFSFARAAMMKTLK